MTASGEEKLVDVTVEHVGTVTRHVRGSPAAAAAAKAVVPRVDVVVDDARSEAAPTTRRANEFHIYVWVHVWVSVVPLPSPFSLSFSCVKGSG